MSKIVSRIPKELEKVPEQVEFFSELMENEKNEKLDENNNFGTGLDNNKQKSRSVVLSYSQTHCA